MFCCKDGTIKNRRLDTSEVDRFEPRNAMNTVCAIGIMPIQY